MTRFSNQRGQAMVLSVLFLTVLVAMAALVLDVGSWYRADRAAQTTADASALAAAQALPDDPAFAVDLAIEYGDKNGGSVEADDVSFSSKWSSNDTVRVHVDRPSEGFFAKLFGIDSVTVGARASARAGTPAQALWVAPIVVNEQHPMLQKCKPDPCDEPTMLEYYNLKEKGGAGGNGPSEPDGAGSFGFINLGAETNPGTSTLSQWIRQGYDKYMALGDYDARTGNPFSSTNVGGALEDKMGEELLFPIYRKLTATGSNAKYDIIGWVGFRLTSMDLTGNDEKLYGNFTRVVWQGIQGSPGSSVSPGVRVVQLVD